VPQLQTPREGVQPRWSGLRVQGTASSPPSATGPFDGSNRPPPAVRRVLGVLAWTTATKPGAAIARSRVLTSTCKGEPTIRRSVAAASRECVECRSSV
jgi:hypothetical protein